MAITNEVLTLACDILCEIRS